MGKKFLCKIICLLLIANCFVGVSFSSVSAQEVTATINYGKIMGLIDSLKTKLSTFSVDDRYDMYNVGKSYFTTNEGIDTLIKIVEDPTLSVSKSLKALVEGFGEQKNELIFALAIIKSIDSDTGNKRENALTNFTAKKEFTSLGRSEASALSNIYSELVGDFATKLEEHQVNDKILLNLFSCIKGSFVLTDDRNHTSKLAVKSIDSDFALRLSQNISQHFSTINGQPIGTGKDILISLIEMVNTSETSNMIDDYKLVFGALDMYVEYSSGGGGGSSGGSSSTSSGTITYANPIIVNEPVVIIAPTPTVETSGVIEKFSDLSTTHWSSPYVSELVSRKVFTGYEDGQFRPDQGITRQEIAVALVRALGLEGRLESIKEASFTDNEEIGDWSKKAIALLVEMKIINGYEDGSFKPSNEISREELAVIIARAITKSAKNIEINFNDKDSIGGWAQDGIKKVYALGIIKGYENKTFQPNNSVTRAEVTTMLYNFMFTENLL